MFSVILKLYFINYIVLLENIYIHDHFILKKHLHVSDFSFINYWIYKCGVQTS